MSEAGEPDRPHGGEYVGPYERWVYDVGRNYTLPGFGADPLGFFGALVEAPADAVPIQPTAPGTLMHGDDRLKVHLPILWPAQSTPRRFYPMILETEPGDKAPQRLLAGLSGVTRTLWGPPRQEIPASSDGEPSPGPPPPRPYFRLNLPIAPRTMHGAPDEMPDCDWTPAQHLPPEPGKLVVVAVIDDDIAFAHHHFRAADGSAPGGAPPVPRSRVEFCWLQSASSDRDQPVLFGRELVRSQIEGLIARHGRDEDALYRTVHDTPRSAVRSGRIATHGSAVLDLAAGFSPRHDGVADCEAIRIIAVELPDTAGWDTSGIGKEMFILSALHYILERTDRIARGYGCADDGVHLLINFSHGFSGGPHDGSSQLEAAISELVTQRRRRSPKVRTELIVPSGNMHLSRLHGVIPADNLRAAQTAHAGFTIGWRRQPNDRTSSYLELWFDTAFGNVDGVTVTIAAPQTSTPVELEPPRQGAPEYGDLMEYLSIDRDGKTIGMASFDHHRGKQWRVLVALAPTEPERRGLACAPAGTWKVAIKWPGMPEATGSVRCYVQRDEERDDRNTGARQSWLEDQEDQRYDATGKLSQEDTPDAFLRRYGALNGLATGPETLVIGGYTQIGNRAAVYSSAGAQSAASGSPGWGKQVSASAVSEHSTAEPGIVAAGSRSGSFATISGTSATAPQIVRAVALKLLASDPGDVTNGRLPDVLDLLHGDFHQQPGPGPGPDQRLGRRLRAMERGSRRRV